MPFVLPVELKPVQVRPVAYRTFSKKHGLNLKATALDVLAQCLGRQFGADWRSAKAERFLDELARSWKEEDRGLFVEGPQLQEIVQNLLNAEAAIATEPEPELGTEPDSTSSSFTSSVSSRQSTRLRNFAWQDYFKVVNAHEQQRLVYNPTQRLFELPMTAKTDTSRHGHVVGDPSVLLSLFQQRYFVLRDRILRNEFFQKSLDGQAASYGLTDIKNMLGRDGKEFFLFGLLMRPDGATGELYLADVSGRIKLEFSDHTAVAPDHYYTVGAFVVCMGTYCVDYFLVGTVGPPVVESRAATAEALGYVDLYGLASTSSAKTQCAKRLEHIDHVLHNAFVVQEQQLVSHRIVALGCNIYLDKTSMVDTLRRCLRSIASSPEGPPMALIIPGSFLSQPFQSNGSSTAIYREAMNSLAALLAAEPTIANGTKIILLPGNNDPWHSLVSGGSTPLWPLLPIPQIFTSRVSRAARDVVWASNPSRLLYLSQEIVLARDNYGQRFRRHALDLGTTIGAEDDIKVDELAGVGELNVEVSSISLDEMDDEAGDRKRAAIELLKEAQAPTKPVQITGDASKDLAESRKVVATILDQCHLAPFVPSTRPVMWEYDVSLLLAQWPTVLLLFDTTSPRFQLTYEGCAAMNPGPFIFDNTANWIEYWPGDGHFEVKSIAA